MWAHFAHIKQNKNRQTAYIEPFSDHPSWSHLGLNQGLPDYESGALTN